MNYMRIWDLPPSILCRQHLLGEHRELHGIWNIVTQGKKGYSNHPETKRWYGRVPALFERHEKLVEEMSSRGYNHKSPLKIPENKGETVWGLHQNQFVHTIEEQIEIIKSKNCECKV